MSFPITPTNNKIYKNFYYNQTIGAWEKREDGSTGDIKSRASLTSIIGWLPTHGETIGNDSSGATYTGEEYRDLFNEVKLSWENTGGEVFDNGDTVLLPDLRGATIQGIGANTMAYRNGIDATDGYYGDDVNAGTGLNIGEERKDRSQGYYPSIRSYSTSSTNGSYNDGFAQGYVNGGGLSDQSASIDNRGFTTASYNDDGENGVPRIGKDNQVYAKGVEYLIRV